mgnify:CR=1 FL=1
MAGCYRYRAAGLRRDETSVQSISSAGPGQGVPSGIPSHRQAINRGPGYAGLWDISPAARRVLPCLQKGGPTPLSPKPPVFRRREPMGVPGKASPSIRAECKGHAQAAQSGRPGSLPGLRSRGRIRPKPPIKSCWHPGTDGAAAGGIPLQGATGQFAPGEKFHGTLPAMFAGRKTGRGQRGPARQEALVTARRDVGTPAGLESGGKAEASYA